MHMLTAIAALTLASVAHPAQGAEFEAPMGCETFLTVQSKACAVSNLYRCDAAPGGSFWEAVFGGNGFESLTAYDERYQWIEAQYAWDQSRERFVPPAEDPINIDALMTDGVDTFRFTMHRTAPGEDRNITIVGADVLSDQTVEIDDTMLAVVNTDLQILAADGSVEYHARGRQYLDVQKRLFFLGTEEVLEPDGTSTAYDHSPIDFIHPDEPGFAQTLPLYECEEFEAALDVRFRTPGAHAPMPPSAAPIGSTPNSVSSGEHHDQV